MLSKEMITFIQSMSGILTVWISLIALIIALRVEIRTQKRFERQIEQAKRISSANIKPVLTISVSEYINYKSFVLSNCGLGTAVLVNVEISRNGSKVDNLAELFSFDEHIIWDTYWTFSHEHYLGPKDKTTLIKLTTNNLKEQGYNEMKSLQILKKWQEQIEGINIKIAYEDIYGNRQKEYIRTFHS